MYVEWCSLFIVFIIMQILVNCCEAGENVIEKNSIAANIFLDIARTLLWTLYNLWISKKIAEYYSNYWLRTRMIDCLYTQCLVLVIFPSHLVKVVQQQQKLEEAFPQLGHSLWLEWPPLTHQTQWHHAQHPCTKNIFVKSHERQSQRETVLIISVVYLIHGGNSYILVSS